MSAAYGSTPISRFYFGPTPVQALYAGSQLIWTAAGISVQFDGDDSPNLTPYGFVHYGPFTEYKVGVQGGAARYVSPDGNSTLGYFTDRVRYATTLAPADNGALQIRPASLGNAPTQNYGPFYTDVFARGSNGGVTNGCGIRLVNGQMAIVSRISNSDVIRSVWRPFAVGDILRLVFTGNVWTLTRNGEFSGQEWTDGGASVPSGAGNRSLLMRFDGGRELLTARKMSPAIDYVEYAA